MTVKVVSVWIDLFFFFNSCAWGQPRVAEDRMYLRIAPDVVKLEQDIYLPKFPGKKLERLVKWEYEYKNGLLVSERSFTPKETLWTEMKFEYSEDGKLLKDSCWVPSYPAFDFYTNYEYNINGQLSKATQINKASGKKSRVDTYSKYKKGASYHKLSQFFGDDGVINYTSVFEDGLKRMVIHSKGFPPLKYEYDSTGRLLSINSRKFNYKLDKKGNAIASVQIERGMRIYNFIRLTYADGTVCGGIKPDETFIDEWDNKKL